ncbi:hypothetical protein KDL45_16045 [bacterium]|nr:hypothetical protein [bacterium]
MSWKMLFGFLAVVILGTATLLVACGGDDDDDSVTVIDPGDDDDDASDDDTTDVDDDTVDDDTADDDTADDDTIDDDDDDTFEPPIAQNCSSGPDHVFECKPEEMQIIILGTDTTLSELKELCGFHEPTSVCVSDCGTDHKDCELVVTCVQDCIDDGDGGPVLE